MCLARLAVFLQIQCMYSRLFAKDSLALNTAKMGWTEKVRGENVRFANHEKDLPKTQPWRKSDPLPRKMSDHYLYKTPA